MLDDDFRGYSSGNFVSAIGAHAEYHYVPESAPKGNWAVSTNRSEPSSQLAWKVLDDGSRRVMAMRDTNKRIWTHPMLVTGDDLWKGYEIEETFAPLSAEGRVGVFFRSHIDRKYYFFGVDTGKAVLLLVQEESDFHVPNEKVLAAAPCAYKAGEYLTATVHVSGGAIHATLNNGVTLDAHDTTLAAGKVGILSDVPANFSHVSVRMTHEAKAAYESAVKLHNDEELALQKSNPKPVLWKKISTDGFGAGRNLRFGDLNGDGQIDVLIGQVVNHGPKDCNSELSCLTAMTFDGDILWRVGEPDPWKDYQTSDVAFQIVDLDGDGHNEVVCCLKFEIVVVDGATGKTKYKVPTPETPPNVKPPYNKYPRILGDALYFCDLRGTGAPRDVILKDRYQDVWAFDDKLNKLWRAQCNTGHYPFAFDNDGDGKDELMVGYTLFGSDGTKLWSLDGKMQDHADGVAIVRMHGKSDEAPTLFCAASDEGAFTADMKGNVLKHHFIGHVQNPAVADFRPDLPGLETVTVNFWGNQGIIHFFDADGNIYHEFEPFQHGSMCFPINWTGRAQEYVVLSANNEDGGLFDGWGRRVVRFPADGHPDMCYDVLNITGDCRDEIVVWNPYEIWVYTQSDGPIKGHLYKPTRNRLCNASNYVAMVSLPGWSE